MKKFIQYSLLVAAQFIFFISFVRSQNSEVQKHKNEYSIDLSGDWLFQVDSLDQGVTQQWYTKKLKDKIKLPGSMTTNNIGNNITVHTLWTGYIVDSSWFYKPEYAKYRQPENIKVPFWLQPIKYYKGAAWYQKEVDIPSSWYNKHITLFLERCHWKTTLWIDHKKVGSENSLAAPHAYDLDSYISTGKHTITICINNEIEDVNVGVSSHSISDHTQTNWNGMVGKLLLTAEPQLYIDNAKLFPDVKKKEIVAVIAYKNISGKSLNAQLKLLATSGNIEAEKLKPLSQKGTFEKDSGTITITYPMGGAPLFWDEFHPNLYNMRISLLVGGNVDAKDIQFGMCSFSKEGTQFTINGHPTFLRGTLECAVTPLTGYPSTNNAYWKHLFSVCKSYGLNHIRFHSWCPPEAAFVAADSAGFYLQIECSSWANQGATISDGKPLDQFIYDESNRIVNAYGNHPSFCMMVYGNEPAGKNLIEYLKGFVEYWKKKDPRHLYSTAAGWLVISENDYNNPPDPRIQHWGEGLKSIINSKSPQTSYDWSSVIAKWQHPTVSHEIGQWCVYPDFKEIPKYTGILKAKNFEIFKETLKDHGMSKLADSFLLASGKLQALCYKADIEAALRTKGFGGFQLLGLSDFPGQGTALVGVVNAFWEDKGYITGKEYSRFCNSTVPLARLSKMVYLNNEKLLVPVEIANFGEGPLNNIIPLWTIKDASGKILFRGNFPKITIPLGNGIKLGEIKQSLSTITKATRIVLTVYAGRFQNSWELFVYPASLPAIDNIFTTQELDARTIKTLNNGGKVLLILKKGSLKEDNGGNIKIGFSSIFWNTAWTRGQPPTTLGILVNPANPALKEFPTEYYSNWEWWDAMSHSNPIILDSVATGLKPIVRVIDDWVTARSLGLVFECNVGKGKLIVSGIDLLSEQDKRPEAKQLLFSLKKYMSSDQFRPQTQVNIEKIKGLIN